MKKFFVLLVATALSTMLYAEQGSSHGQPFLTLQSQIDKLVGDADTVEARLIGLEAATQKLEDEVVVLKVDVATLVVDLDDLYTIVDDNADDIDDLKGDIQDIQDDIDDNQFLIDTMSDEIVVIQDNMKLKQNIINGTCPDGQAVVQINDEPNDGALICEAVSGDLLKRVITKSIKVTSGDTTANVIACPTDYIASGGGFFIESTDLKVLHSGPTSVNRWVTKVKNTSLWDEVVRSRVVCLKLQ